MKNILKLSGIIVMAAVIGFSFAACGNGSTNGGAYMGYFLMPTDTNYENVFTGETAPAESAPLVTLSGTKDYLIGKVEEASNGSNQLKFGPYSYAEVGEAFDVYVPNAITVEEKTTLMNELKNKGYVVGVNDGGTYSDPADTLVWGVFSE